MFLNFNVLLDKEIYNAKRLVLEEGVQKELSKYINDCYANFNYNFLKFDGRYKPEQDEAFYIEDFEIPETIIQVKSNQIGQDIFSGEDEQINAIFTYIKKEDAFVFQNVMRNQIITRRGFNLFLDKNTFKKFDTLALNIKDEVDCIYKDKKLYFKSYWQARQIFDLREYYKIATDEEIHDFMSHDIIKVPCPESFKNNMDSWIRRKISLIQDSGVLETYQPQKIKEIAEEYSVNINVEDRKIVIPSEKEEVKILLKFLDESIYKGPLTSETYETSSKREFAGST